MKDIEKVLNSKLYINLWSLIFKKYHNLINIFKKWNADKLPPHYEEYDIEIELKSEKTSNFEPLYSIFCEELQVLWEYLDEHLVKRFIWSSYSSFVFPVLFARKPGEELYFCIDYQTLNVITI